MRSLASFGPPAVTHERRLFQNLSKFSKLAYWAVVDTSTLPEHVFLPSYACMTHKVTHKTRQAVRKPKDRGLDGGRRQNRRQHGQATQTTRHWEGGIGSAEHADATRKHTDSRPSGRRSDLGVTDSGMHAGEPQGQYLWITIQPYWAVVDTSTLPTQR